MQVVEHDTESGHISERSMTEAELAQRESDSAAASAAQVKAVQEAQARADSIAHAKTLGFTDAMIAVMYPGLSG